MGNREEMDGETGKPLVFTRAAARSLSRMPKEAEDLVRQKLQLYARDPASLANNVKALRGEGKQFRLRGGDWRAVGPRGSVYDQDIARDDRQNQDTLRRGYRDPARG